MPAVTLAVLSAVALALLGDLRSQADIAVPILVAWGLGVFLLPRPQTGMRALLAVALVIRALLVFTEPTLSDDVFRYLWEGHVVAGGDNPFLYAPADAHWGADAIRARVNHPEVSTIYPPVALWAFATVATLHYAPIAMKLAMALADLGIVAVLFLSLRARNRSSDAAWLYALHPLGSVEAAHSGHLEPLALLFSLLAVLAWDRGRAGVVWALLGGGTKLLPFALVPSLVRNRPKKSVGEVALGMALLAVLTVPFLSAGATLFRGFRTYAEHWSFNASFFLVLQSLVGTHARTVGLLLGAVITITAAFRRRDPAEVLLWTGGAFVLLSPTVHPWYVLWAWVPALLVGVRSWSVLASLVPLSYWVLVGYHAGGSWTEPWWPRWIVYPPFLLLLSWECVSRWTQPGPWAIGRRPTPSP